MNKSPYEGIDPSRSPAEEAEEREVIAILHRCFQELSLLDQQVFMMRAVREDSYQEITQVLNLKQGTVASKYNRAKEKIKQCLEKQGIAGTC
ncbi:MAG TPA: sigma-70 family RNA polymerase sigma factor [Candidatus Binatia bacterium]|jgi:RNA polymerase sigma factor (sigma-70 family)|nr:sigma-70 family RNA polymerase sigma factor [Candidatus Binatia bacterium]